MSLLEEMAYDGGFFPYGLYWLHLETSKVNARIKDFVQQAKGKLLPIKEATVFLNDVVHRCTGS